MDKKKKSTRRSTAPKIIDLDVQQRRLALITQKKCEAIALHIVEKLIDCPVEDDVFLQSLKYINQCHYQDIVEERVISRLCGYPVCGNEILDMPSKKFKISAKTNKIYDITERKNYCSNFCYKAGTYIKDQMLTSPLWYRDNEEIPNFHLLPKTEPGDPGEVIDQGLIKLSVDEEENFTSISKFTQDMINVIPENIYDKIDENNPVAAQETQKENLNKEGVKETVNEVANKIEIQMETENNNYFTNLYAPSLADILKENSEYFEKNSKHEIKVFEKINKVPDIKSDKTELNTKNINKDNVLIIEKENKKVTISESKPSTSKSETCRIGFNRTIINTKSRGILKKSKDKNSEKKCVSFTAENTVHILEQPQTENDTNEQFKQPEKPKTDENGRKYKNANLIGIVQEKSTYKRKLSNLEIEQKSTEHITNNNEKVENKIVILGNNADKLQINNTLSTENIENEKLEIITNKIETIVLENKVDEKLQKNNITATKEYNDEKQQINSITQNTQQTSKEKRLNRLKNSSSYKKANLLSKAGPLPTIFEFPDLKSRLDTCMSEWITFETLLFLYGEEHVKKIISEKSFKQYYNKKKNIELDDKKQKQYEEICKRLSLMEFADQKFDESVTGKKRRPLPRYDDLRQAAEHMDLRVQAFYSNSYDMYEDDGDTDTDTESVGGDLEEPQDKSNVEQGAPAVLPLVDNKDIMATRRRIFQTCISRSISTVCEILQDSPNRLLTEIKHLINTFEFTAVNIVFKTVEWQFVTFLLIKILAIRDKELQDALASEEVSQFMSSSAKHFGLQDTYFLDLVSQLQVNNLLDKCMRKDCIE